MCGIAGVLNYGPGAEDAVAGMKQRMTHRGPDTHGTWHDDQADVWFGHVRLSILDLSETGAQPMLSASGRFAITLNGEIYNYETLKEMLREKGVTQFRGTSDTEVLLEALEAFGVEQTLSVMKGMFAAALYDRQEKTLTLFRDRAGEKPLFYGFTGKTFVFASDIGAIRTLPSFQAEIDERVLGIYFRHGYIPAPYTIYRGISKLMPGTYLTLHAPFSPDQIKETVYWSMTEAAVKGRDHPFRGSFEEASERLEELLKASIRGQLMGDVPVGAFLSGGIDSATSVALMQTVSPGKVKSFTIGTEDPAFNEAVYAKEIAAHIGTEHTELYISDKDAQQVIPLLPRMFSEPFADSSQIPTYLVSKMAREHVTVSLSGDAGDELFAGYNSYTSLDGVWKKIRHIPYPVKAMGSSVLKSLPLPDRARRDLTAALLNSRTPEDLHRNMFDGDPLTGNIPLQRNYAPYAYSSEIAGSDVLNEPVKDWMLMHLRMYHPDDILVKVDRCAMAVSLESRVPMLDRDVIEFAWTLPLSYLREGNTGKRILRSVLYRHVPKELMDRPKTGFSIPIMKWVKDGELRSWAEDLLDERKIREEGLLDPATVRTLWKRFTEEGKWCVQIWFLLMFEAWYRAEYRNVTP